MRYTKRLIPAAVLALVACSSTSEVPLAAAESATAPTITTDKSVYTRAELDVASGQGIRATLVAADKPFYARLGDAFNSAIDQNPLFIAEGSDGMMERQSGSSWTKVTGGVLVEGVREVVISPAKSYTVMAFASPSVAPGMYRLTVMLRETPGGSVTSKIVSPSFEVR